MNCHDRYTDALTQLIHVVLVIRTVDGRNPAPPGRYKNLVNTGRFSIPTGAGCLPSIVALPCTEVAVNLW